MQKTALGLVALLGMICCTLAIAAPVASVVALASPVWVQRADAKIEVELNSRFSVDDRVFTGAGGLLEVQLWSGIKSRVYSDSEIRIIAPAQDNPDPGDNSPVLLLELGRICMESPPASSTGHNFRLKVAQKLLATIHQYGHICVSNRAGMSSINLRAGSVQITNLLDPGLVILSEAGIEFRVDDEGSYQLLPSAPDIAIADMNSEPFIAVTMLKQKPALQDKSIIVPETVTGKDSATKASGATIDEGARDYVYTVYLFSTRSEEIASQVNEKFQQAGYETRILTNAKDTSRHYRVAVTGFESRQSAREFGDSIVGTMGIRDTWIGGDRPEVED